MDKKQKEQVEQDLIDFIHRASQKEATPEEIAALPEVACALATLDCSVLPLSGK